METFSFNMSNLKLPVGFLTLLSTTHTFDSHVCHVRDRSFTES